MATLIEAFILGLVGGAIPGSVLTILLISVIHGGFSAGLRSFGWSLLAEITVVGILLLLLFTLPIPAILFNYIGFVGCFVLFYFAWRISHLQKVDQPERVNVVFSAKEIYTLSATNAPLYIFWVTVCSPLIWQLANTWPLSISMISFMTAFELGWALSTFVIMMVFVKARKYITEPKVMHKVYLCASLVMLVFGLQMLYLSLVSLRII